MTPELLLNGTSLSLSLDNKLTCNGMRPLSTFLSYHPLQELSLQGNKITDQGASFLGESLRSNETLKILCLSNNQIGDQGIAQLAEALRHNKTLQQLDLEMNRIGDEGVIHLAEALRSNRTLKQLDLKRQESSSFPYLLRNSSELFSFIQAIASLQSVEKNCSTPSISPPTLPWRSCTSILVSPLRGDCDSYKIETDSPFLIIASDVERNQHGFV